MNVKWIGLRFGCDDYKCGQRGMDKCGLESNRESRRMT